MPGSGGERGWAGLGGRGSGRGGRGGFRAPGEQWRLLWSSSLAPACGLKQQLEEKQQRAGLSPWGGHTEGSANPGLRASSAGPGPALRHLLCPPAVCPPAGAESQGRSLPPQASLGGQRRAAPARTAGPGALAVPVWLGSLERLRGLRACPLAPSQPRGPQGLSDHTPPPHLSGRDLQTTQPEEKQGGGQRTEVAPSLLQPRLSEPCPGWCGVPTSAGVTGSVVDEGGVRPGLALTVIHPPCAWHIPPSLLPAFLPGSRPLPLPGVTCSPRGPGLGPC